MSSRKAPYEKYIIPLNMNKLEGRMLSYPAKNRANNILLIGDLGTDLEYWWGLVRGLHDLGSVTVPELPGIGGMDSFYKINKVPSIDTYADYIASFIKLRYRRKKFIAIGAGFGFVVLTRTLQRYPELKNNVKFVVSLGGYADHDDYIYPRWYYYYLTILSSVFRRRLSSLLLKNTVVNRVVLKTLCHQQLSELIADKDQRLLVSQSVDRLALSHTRTLFSLIHELCHFSNCEREQMDLQLWHVGVPVKSLDWGRNEQHLRIAFSDFNYLNPGRKINRYLLKQDKRSAAIYLPKELKLLIKNS